MLALGHIWTNKLRTVLTMAGIIIAVASVISVIGGLTGLQGFVVSEFEAFGTNRVDIWPRRPDSGPLLRVPWYMLRFVPKQFEGLLEYCPSVAVFSSLTDTEAPLKHGTRSIEKAYIVGVEPSWYKIENRSVIEGRFFSLLDQQLGKKVCCITPEVRDKLLLDRDCVGQQILVGNYTFTIVGLIQPRPDLKLFNDGRPHMPEVIVPFKSVYAGTGSWMQGGASLRSSEVADEAQAEMKFFLRRTRGIKPGEPDTFRIWNSQRELASFKETALVMTAVAGCIVGVSLLVGGIGVMNIMLVCVSERTREIGLRKAVGARPSAILFQFLVEAVTLCLFGGAIGVALGYLLTTVIAGAAGSAFGKAHVPSWAVLISFGFATAVGLFFGMFPAIKAARLDPIEALRHE